jgi:DNA-binding MarR family transcriptional regulator
MVQGRAKMDERVAGFARLIAAIQEEELRMVRTSGRSLTEYYALQILAFNPGTTVTEIAERLALAKSSVSVVIDGLVKEGLVKRSERGQKDRRTIALSLTRRGGGWMQRFWGAKASLMMEVIGGLKPDEQRVAEQIFKQVSETLERRRLHSGS